AWKVDVEARVPVDVVRVRQRTAVRAHGVAAVQPAAQVIAGRVVAGEQPRAAAAGLGGALEPAGGMARGVAACGQVLAEGHLLQDRKSTRLNSSHVKIS